MASATEERTGAGGLGRSATVGVMWSVGQKWVMRISGFVTVAILTRLLSPADFGTVTVAMSVLPLIYLLTDMGFGTYLMQSKEVQPTTLSTVFWYYNVVGLLMTG